MPSQPPECGLPRLTIGFSLIGYQTVSLRVHGGRRTSPVSGPFSLENEFLMDEQTEGV